MNEYRAKVNWQSPVKAAAYRKSRDPGRYKRSLREDEILGGWMDLLPAGASILDCPCGTGRFIPLITGKGFDYTGADISEAMMDEARKAFPGQTNLNFLRADAEQLPFADNAFDCVILWRFLHHIIDPATRRRILAEAARVSRRKIFLSFYHPLSFTALRLAVKNRFSARKQPRGLMSHWQLRREAQACGLELVETKSYQKFISINWFACLTKNEHVRDLS